MMTTRAPRSLFVIGALLVFTLVVAVQVRYIGTPGNDWHDAINSDGKGYYEYLRMFLTPGDPTLHGGAGPLHPTVDGRVIKHFGGTAVLMAPFVLSAHLYTILNTGKPEDGYSLHYQIAVGVAALFYLAVGLFALRKFLTGTGADDDTVSIVLVLVTLGTGLITQVVVHPAMSHVYGFCIVALLLCSVQRSLQVPTRRGLLAFAALLGLATWIRPVNALILLALPLCAIGTTPNGFTVRRLLCSRWTLVAGLVFMAIIGQQATLWYSQCGDPLVRPYPGEGFHWGRPEITASLFSPRNGLFFYWPILLLVVPGSWVLYRRAGRRALFFWLFLVFFTCTTASWWNWAYGDNFGQRTYLDMLPVLALPLAAAVPKRRPFRWLLLVPAGALCALNLFQSWQYKNHLLITGQTDLAKYKHLFLCTDPHHAIEVGGHDELPLYAPYGRRTILTEHVDHPDQLLHTEEPGRYELTRTPVPDEAIGLPIYWEVDLVRSEQRDGASQDARVFMYSRNGGLRQKWIDFGMNVVPNAPTGPVGWHYAFNIHDHHVGDTLVVATTLGSGYTVDGITMQLSVPATQ